MNLFKQKTMTTLALGALAFGVLSSDVSAATPSKKTFDANFSKAAMLKEDPLINRFEDVKLNLLVTIRYEDYTNAYKNKVLKTYTSNMNYAKKSSADKRQDERFGEVLKQTEKANDQCYANAKIAYKSGRVSQKDVLSCNKFYDLIYRTQPDLLDNARYRKLLPQKAQIDGEVSRSIAVLTEMSVGPYRLEKLPSYKKKSAAYKPTFLDEVKAAHVIADASYWVLSAANSFSDLSPKYADRALAYDNALLALEKSLEKKKGVVDDKVFKKYLTARAEMLSQLKKYKGL